MGRAHRLVPRDRWASENHLPTPHRRAVTIADDILVLLRDHPSGLDDDEIASLLHLSQRQAANQTCNKLASAGKLRRITVGGKIRNFLYGQAPLPVRSPPVAEGGQSPDRIWHWEGNVQASIVEDLRDEYWAVTHVDTASKQHGKDIEATKEGRTLWVTVKGYPESRGATNPSTQARHWFSHAIFDVVLYRNEDPDVELAVGLPDFKTYRALAGRVHWLEEAAPFRFIWIRGPETP